MQNKKKRSNSEKNHKRKIQTMIEHSINQKTSKKKQNCNNKMIENKTKTRKNNNTNKRVTRGKHQTTLF